MDGFTKETVWRQFGAAIESLERAIDACPDARWSEDSQPPYWYLVYHTLFWLDYYLSSTGEGFAPPAPFTLGELDPAGVMPDRIYTRVEMKRYLDHGYAKCRARILAMTPDQERQMWQTSTGPIPWAELLLYNMRHVQHHTAQLNLMLRLSIDSAPRWVARARTPLEPA